MNFYDTISAISTHFGKAGVAVIRISGQDAFAVAGKIFRKLNGEEISDPLPRRAYYGEIIFPGGENDHDPSSPVGVGKKHIDDGIATFFKSPNSFTGEDTVEISCHGGTFVTSKVLSATFAAGARQAEAGEFTRRAFVNGKMKLSEAEALGAVLEAKNDTELSAASGNMRGALSGEIGELYESLRLILASAYAKIDFPDEDLSELSDFEIGEKLSALLAGIDHLLGTYRTGKAISEGIPTVICGAANTGKSTLFNRLSRSDDAIVTSIAGTTRDVLRSEITLGKVTLTLCDTAGLRESSDTVESIGIGRAKDEIGKAELILAVFDVSAGNPERESDAEALIKLLESYSGEKIAILNKSDLEKDTALCEKIREKFPRSAEISAKNGDGEDALVTLIESLYIDGKLEIGRDAMIMNSRQFASLSRAKEAIERSIAAFREGLAEDMYCRDAEDAMEYLGEIDGREASEEIVAGIFSHFCVGK